MPIISPEMSLPIPIVGVDPAPDWATLIVQCFNIIDGHDHTEGNGAPIVPGALNINDDLTMQGNNLTYIRALRFDPQADVIPATGFELTELYVVDSDLYYNDADGNEIRLTEDGGVAGSPGSITGLVDPASASYVPVATTFYWESDVDTAADMDFRSAIFRNADADSFGLTLQAPTLASDYEITLPALPASQKFMTLDASGNMAAPWAVDGSTLEIASGTTLQVKNLGITAGKIANNVVGSTQLAATIGAMSGKISWASGTGSYVNVTSLAVTQTFLAASDRPIYLTVIPAIDGTLAYVHVDNGDSLNWRILRDGATVVGSGSYTIIGGIAALPVSGIHCMDVAASAGSHTYQVQFLCTGGSGITAGTLWAYQPQV